MNLRFLLVFLVFSAFQCTEKQNGPAGHWTVISKNVRFQTTETEFLLKSGKFSWRFQNDKLPLNRVVLLNASLVGYFTELNLQDRIIGVSSPEYIYSQKVMDRINKGQIQNVGNEQKYDVEKIISLKPDAIFTNYISTFENTYEILKNNGIQIIFLDEYLEQNPLEKTKYLLLFGHLFKKEKEAHKVYADIASTYAELQKTVRGAAAKPVVLANEMYGNQWYLPGGQSALATFLKDAHSEYINANSQHSRAEAYSFESVFVKAQKAEFWVNVGNHAAKRDLLQINPNYAKMNVFKKGKLYTVTGREKGKTNDYFESGVVRADLVLKDYIAIFHPELFPDYNLTFMKELK